MPRRRSAEASQKHKRQSFYGMLEEIRRFQDGSSIIQMNTERKFNDEVADGRLMSRTETMLISVTVYRPSPYATGCINRSKAEKEAVHS